MDECRLLSQVEGMEGEQSSDVNISDVIEVIQTDEMYGGGGGSGGAGGGPGTGADPESRRPRAYVKIVEQPASKALRFRYECEGRSAGSIPGVNSTHENKTYPSIQIVGHHGRAVVVVSCVTKEAPYRPHPHNLVGKEGCNRGVCTLKMQSDTITFSNLGIQCVKKKDIEEALKVREEIRVDPFRTGYSHKTQPSSIDLNSVRLCFQVFLEGPKKDEYTIPLRPVVSDPIYDKKAMSDLTICKLSDCSATVAGGKEVILLCEKVAKEDIQVRFYEERDGELYWEGQGDFQPTQVHKQVAIAFRTPKYKTIDIQKPINVWVQLRRPSDGAFSESVPFQFIPLDSDPVILKRKRQKYDGESSPQNVLKGAHDEDSRSTYVGSLSPDRGYHGLQVKREPSEQSPIGYGYGGGGGSPMYPGGPSPRSSSPHDAPSPIPPSYATPNLLTRHTSGGSLLQPMKRPQQQRGPNPYPESAYHHLTTGTTTKPTEASAFPVFYEESEASEASSYARPGLTPVKMPVTECGKSDEDPSRARHYGEGNVQPTILDMDSQNYSLELSLGNLDSAELARMAMMTDANLSENLSSNLTLDDKVTDVSATSKSAMDCDNMTDSLTRVADNVIQELVSLGDMARQVHHH